MRDPEVMLSLLREMPPWRATTVGGLLASVKHILGCQWMSQRHHHHVELLIDAGPCPIERSQRECR